MTATEGRIKPQSISDPRMAYAATFPEDSSAAYAISVATPCADTAKTVSGWIAEGAIVYCVSPEQASQMFGRWLDKDETK